MTMLATEPDLAVQTFQFSKDVSVAAPAEIVFDAVLAECGPESQMPDGTAFPMKLEPWPGGRWFRDLGDNAGHLWGHVQVIKPPKLLEICGPMFVSYPATNHLQYRLTPEGDGTRLKLTHRAFGYFPQGFITGADEGFSHFLKRIAEIAQRMNSERRKGAGR